MSHLDEGTLHALLDGELELHEVREIQAHLGSCTACDSRLQAAKDVYGEADRLVASVQFPGSPRMPGGAEAREPEPEYAPAATQQAPRRERRFADRPIIEQDEPQIVILPEENLWPERRRRILLATRWAAVLLVAIGAGFLASEVRKNAGPEALSFDEAPAAVVSPEETVGPEGTSSRSGFAMGAPADSAPATTPAPTPPSAARQQRAAKTAPPPAAAAAPEPEPAPVEDQAADLADTQATAVPGAANEAPSTDTAVDEDPMMEERVLAGTREDIREEAAEALAELDRQRRRERAAAATQAIDRARREADAVRAQAPPPAPAPRTLEQRSGIYLRIGLDEAARQLGRPVHVIEGLNAQFMGLVQGRQSPGADDARPAVRVVYQDSQGRMILLDQQRVRPGQSWPSGATHWTVGEIGLHLHGEASAEVLRNLRPRVR
jgi:Putative zinc-finger